MPPSNGQGRIVSLGATAQFLSSVFRQPKNTIAGIDNSQQFGPLQPFKPIGGDDAGPWLEQIQPGQNLIYTPRQREKYSTTQLREASMYDLARIIIENVLDQVSRMPLNLRLKRLPGESGKDYAKRKPDPAILNDVGDILDNPNTSQTRGQFARQFLDDMLVIDAASILIRRNRKGGVFDFRAIDGAQIVRYFDSYGATPQPPDPAYAQIWDAGQSGGVGIPWVDLTTDQLIYAMRNLKTYALYGLSPLNQAITMVQTGALRLEFQKDYYTAGSVPDAMQVVPSGISKDKFKESQKAINSELSGVLFKRRQIRLIQGFQEDPSKEQFLFPKEALLKDEFDDYVIRVLCYCFGTSPQRLQRVMGMRSGQVNQDSAEKEGLEPWLDFAEQCVWNRMVRALDFAKGYEATYEQDSDVDPHTQAQIDDLNVRNGTSLINEVREKRGDKPYDDVPEAESPMVATASGFVPLSLDAQVDHAKKMFAATPKPEPGQGGSGKDPKAQKIEKRKRAQIDAGKWSPHLEQAKGRLERALRKVFQRQKEKAEQVAHRLLKVRKASDSEKKADEIYSAIQKEFASLPPEARAALEAAALSGIGDGILQIEVNDAGLLSSTNAIAAQYAEKRAAELVGMRYNEEGELVANPNARFAISDTTRNRLREIVKNAFEEKTPFEDVISEIRDADIFSDARALMIARTEVAQAQISSNYEVWKRSGLVKKVKWLAVGPDPCIICLTNSGQVRELGEKFPSGDRYPTAHPNCYCILQAVEFNE